VISGHGNHALRHQSGRDDSSRLGLCHGCGGLTPPFIHHLSTTWQGNLLCSYQQDATTCTPLLHHYATKAVTDTDRADQLRELYHQLDALITADEMELYPFLAHLEDLITDLDQ